MKQPAGREAEFENMARHYAKLIRAIARRVAGPEAGLVVEDVEQQVLMALWKVSAGREQTIQHPSSYVYRAALRETVRLLRQEHRRKEVPVSDWDPEDTALPDAGRIVEGKELAGLIDEVLGSMARERRHAVQAHLVGFSVKEIMEMFEWSYNRARNLIARGMADLRRGLRERGVDG